MVHNNCRHRHTHRHRHGNALLLLEMGNTRDPWPHGSPIEMTLKFRSVMEVQTMCPVGVSYA